MEDSKGWEGGLASAGSADPSRGKGKVDEELRAVSSKKEYL